MTTVVVVAEGTEQLAWAEPVTASVVVTGVCTRRRGPGVAAVLRDAVAEGVLAGPQDTAFLLGDTLVLVLPGTSIDPAFDRADAIAARLPRAASARTAVARCRASETVAATVARAAAALPARGAVLAL